MWACGGGWLLGEGEVGEIIGEAEMDGLRLGGLGG